MLNRLRRSWIGELARERAPAAIGAVECHETSAADSHSGAIVNAYRGGSQYAPSAKASTDGLVERQRPPGGVCGCKCTWVAANGYVETASLVETIRR